MLLRLNQELLPEPGRPIERTTTPLYFLGTAGSLVTVTGRATGRGADSGSVVGSDIELGRKGACTEASIASAGLARPRPRRPPPRRPRPGPPSRPSADCTGRSGKVSDASGAAATRGGRGAAER